MATENVILVAKIHISAALPACWSWTQRLLRNFDSGLAASCDHLLSDIGERRSNKLVGTARSADPVGSPHPSRQCKPYSTSASLPP